MEKQSNIQNLEKQFHKLEKANKELKRNLKEREKELGCLYKISDLVDKNDHLDEIIKGTVDILANSWQYPDITCAKITVGKKEFKTDNFKNTKWQQKTEITIEGNIRGEILVGYLEKKPTEDEGPFLKEERSLLGAVSERLSRIIERKLTQKELQKERHYLKTLIGTSPVAIVKVDKEGNIVFANKEAEKVLNLTKSDLKNRTYDHKDWQIKDFNGNEFPNDQLPFNIVRKTKEPVSDVRYTIESPNQKTKYLSINAAPLLDKNDNFEGMVSIIQDITESQKRRDKLEQNEKELQEYKNRLESTMKVGNLAWWEMDIKTGETKFNDQKAEMLGYSPDRFKHYEDFMNLVHPDDYDRAMQAMQDHLEGKAPVYKTDYRIKTKNGNYKWFHDVGGITVQDEDGNPVKVCGVVVDITERKYIEEALKERLLALSQPLNKSGEIKFQELFNLDNVQKIQDNFAQITNFASIITKPDGQPITKPSNFSRVCTLIRNKGTGKQTCKECFSELGEPSSKDTYIKHCPRLDLLHTAAPITIDGEHIANWIIGQVRDESLPEEKLTEYAKRAGLDQDDFIEAYRAIPILQQDYFKKIAGTVDLFAKQLSKVAYQNVQQARLINDKEKAERDLKKQEEQFNKFFNSASEMMFLKDSNLRYLMVNDAYMDYIGKPKEDIINKTDEEILQPELKKQCIKSDQYVLHNKSPVLSIEEDENSIYEVRKFPIELDNEIGIGGIIRDITKIEKAREEKNRLKQQLQQSQKMESIGRLAGGIAHDMNNLLSPIMGYSQMLQKRLDKGTKHRKYIDTIYKAGTSAQELVRQLLAFSRKQELKLEEIDLKDVIKGFKKLLRKTIREDIEINYNFADDISMIKADKGQIEQVLMNIAANAEDAMPQGGKLTIETNYKYLDEGFNANFLNLEAGPYVVLKISDTGEGIDQETQKKIFEPFFSTKGDQGTGMGLSTVYGIIKQFNGDIHVNSTSSEGSTFTIYLPAISKNSKPERKENIEELPRGSETILVAEDNKEIRNLVKDSLSNLGYNIILAKNGRVALDKVEQYQGEINLLLTDVVMPELNGKQLYNRLIEGFPNLKTIYMSEYLDNVLTAHELIESEINFIHKPLDIKKLAVKIRDILDSEKN